MADNDLYKNFLVVFFNFMTGIIGILIINVVYPGIFAVPTIIAGYFMYTRLQRYIRSTRMFIGEWFKRKVVFYNSYVLTLNNIISLRHISKQRYLENYFVFVTEEFVRMNSHAGTAGNRWLGVRVSITMGFIATAAYLCPLIQQYYHVWDFSKSIWILGLGLVWLQKTMDYFSDACVGFGPAIKQPRSLREAHRATSV